MLSLRSLALVLLAPIVHGAATTDKSCTLRANGEYFDLNPLTSKKDYQFKTPGKHDFVFNVCKPVSHDTWNLHGVDKPGDVGGFLRGDHGDFSVGEANTQLTINTIGPILTLSKGSVCKGAQSDSNSQLRGAAVIQFMCDKSVAGVGSPELAGQLPEGDDSPCHFFINWRTQYACPASEPSEPWGFFFTILVIIAVPLTLYIVVGILYNRFVLDLHGVDQIPQFSLSATKHHLNSNKHYLEAAFFVAADAWDAFMATRLGQVITRATEPATEWVKGIWGRGSGGHPNLNSHSHQFQHGFDRVPTRANQGERAPSPLRPEGGRGGEYTDEATTPTGPARTQAFGPPPTRSFGPKQPAGTPPTTRSFGSPGPSSPQPALFSDNAEPQQQQQQPHHDVFEIGGEEGDAESLSDVMNIPPPAATMPSASPKPSVMNPATSEGLITPTPSGGAIQL